jgi:hypothetical protein
MEKHVHRGLEARAVDNVVDTHIMAVRPPFAIVNDGVIVADELDNLDDDEGHALPLDVLQGLLCTMPHSRARRQGGNAARGSEAQ